MHYLSPQSLQSFLLCLRVDPCPNNEGDDVEEWYPRMLGQELLSERQSQWGGNPADFHDGHESSSDSSSNLMEGPGAGNHSH